MKRRLIFIAVILMLTAGSAVALPGFGEVKNAYRSSEAILLDRHGEVLHELRIDLSSRRLAWVKIEDVSPVFIRALVRAEDRRFFEHEGVDWRALAGAAVDRVLKRGHRGGSTLTMQLAAHLDPALKPQGAHRNLTQKIDQISLARELERRWSKNQILEAYLNLVTFRGELVGLGAAARGLFGKAPSGLDEAEAALLVTLLRSPRAAPEAVGRRACGLARALRLSVGDEAVRRCAAEAFGDPIPFRAEGGPAPMRPAGCCNKAESG